VLLRTKTNITVEILNGIEEVAGGIVKKIAALSRNSLSRQRTVLFSLLAGLNLDSFLKVGGYLEQKELAKRTVGKAFFLRFYDHSYKD